MPYSLQGNCVYKGKKRLKCYDNHKDALAYFRALKLNVENSEAIQEFSMYISKSSLYKGEMRWQAVNSDTEWDLYGERMSLELYRSMIGKINSKTPPPEQFADAITSDYWKGGMPYLSIAHYSDGNGKAVPGDVRELFIDGNQLKAKGALHESSLGRAVWKSLKQDEINYKNGTDENRIRISIAFLDLAHKHGENGKVFVRDSISSSCEECKRGVGEKIYLDGYLVHLALTRVPVNPRTVMEVEDIMAKKSKPTTKKEDAVSILGDTNLADAVEEATLTAKSEALDEAMVEMSEADEEAQEEELVREESDTVAVEEESQAEEAPVEERSPMEDEYDAVGQKSADVMWQPYGGATSMAEAKKFTEAQKESWRVSDLYYTFTDVARNIMDAPDIADKAMALSSLVDEFKSSLVSKSLYEEFTKIKNGEMEENYMAVRKSELLEVIKSMQVPAPQAEETPVQEQKVEKSALEASVEKLYNSVRDVVGKSGSLDAKLQEVQPVLDELGTQIMDEVRKSVGEAPVVVPDANTEVLEAIGSLKSQLAEFATELATLKSANAQPSQTRVPAPRSIAPVMKSNAETTATQENPNSVRNIIRRQLQLDQ